MERNAPRSGDVFDGPGALPLAAEGILRRLRLLRTTIVPLIALVLAVLAIPGVAWADTVSLGIAVENDVQTAQPGEEASVSLGMAVGLAPEPAPGDGPGTATLGIAVGYDRAAQGEVAVTFDAGEGAFTDGSSSTIVTVPAGSRVEPPAEDPRLAGWQLPESGKWAADDGAVWDFSRPVTGDMVLHARWQLRLDVTVPVSVGFAVNADTGEATGPEPGKYKVKSRTVRPVQVERLDLEARDEELDIFFALAGDEAGERPLEGADEATVADWEKALRGTVLSLRSEGAAGSVELPFAGEHKQLEDKDGAAYWAWTGGKPVPEGDRGAWALPASDRGIADPGIVWDGSGADRVLGIAFGLDVSDELKVKTGQPGAVPIAHLKVTVSTKG